MKKKAQVIKLIINKPGAAIYHCSNTRDFFITQGTDADIPYHLYILSDEEIKEGDWYVWLGNKQICQAIGYRETDMDGLNAHVKANDVVKIIATTDKSLVRPLEEWEQIGIAPKGYNQIPQIPEPFIKAYVEANGEIDKVMLEYDCLASVKMVTTDFSDDKEPIDLTESKCIESKLKTTSNNEVIIHLPEEKMYSRESMINKINEAFQQIGYMITIDTYPDGGIESIEGLDKWIEDNL